MPNFLYKLIVRLFIKFLSGNVSYQNIDDKRIEDFVKFLSGSVGFSHYFRKRDLIILKHLGSGLSKEKYWMALGQRVELLRLASEIRKYEKSKKKKGRGKSKKEDE